MTQLYTARLQGMHSACGVCHVMLQLKFPLHSAIYMSFEQHSMRGSMVAHARCFLIYADTAQTHSTRIRCNWHISMQANTLICLLVLSTHA